MRKPPWYAKGWELGNVAAMLEKAGDDAARPEVAGAGFGIVKGSTSGRIRPRPFDLRLHKLTGLEL